jgi:hypothetical protein
MTTIVIHQGDAYQISFTSEGIESILRFSGCRDGPGEPVDYKTISPQLRVKIQQELKRKLKVRNKV